MQDVRWRHVADAASQPPDAVERDGIEEASNAPAQETIALDLSRNALCTRARAGKAPPEMMMAASEGMHHALMPKLAKRRFKEAQGPSKTPTANETAATYCK